MAGVAGPEERAVSESNAVGFLRTLGKALLSTRVSGPDRFGHCTELEDYTDRKLTAGELKLILKATKDDDSLILYPSMNTFGFHSCFEVWKVENVAPGLPMAAELLIKWRLDQSPAGWTWQRYSEHFPDKETVKHYGFRAIGTEVDYIY